jgi:hypothetical protein
VTSARGGGAHYHPPGWLRDRLRCNLPPSASDTGAPPNDPDDENEKAFGEDVAKLVGIRRRLVGGVLCFLRGAGAEKKDRAFILDGIRKQGGDLNSYRRLSLGHWTRPEMRWCVIVGSDVLRASPVLGVV